MCGFALLAEQVIGSSLKGSNSSKGVIEIIGPALFRIDSVIVSARTVD